MSTLALVVASLKARAASNITTLPVYWDKDARPELPDDPSPFAFLMIEAGPGRFVAFGGGLAANLQRSECDLTALVFIPRDWGLEQHATYGEHVASAFRSYRDSNVFCFAASVRPAVDGSNLKPDGLDSEVENYACTVVSVRFHYDLIG